MTVFRAAAVQLRSGLDPDANVAAAEELIRAAAGDGARYVLTPEMTVVLDIERDRLMQRVTVQDEDRGLARLQGVARDLGIFLHIGSMAVLAPSGQIANRGLLIAPDGSIAAAYDKLHMFDVDLNDQESYRESTLFEAGDQAVVANLGFARVGLSICYDLRFPHLYRALAQKGADVLAVPAAFTHTTGRAHWHVLLRARAIENGAFVIAAAQGGRHEDGRTTYGHSLIVAPWGEVLAELGDEPGFVTVDIDTDIAERTRRRIPSLTHDTPFEVARLSAVGEPVS